MGAAVHLVFTARRLTRDASDSVFVPSSPLLCPYCSPLAPHLPEAVTWGMGQHPQDPSSIEQHVEELGHSNRPSGHWTAPKGLVSVNRMTQDSPTRSVKAITPVTRGAAGTRACRPGYRGAGGPAPGLGEALLTPSSHKPVITSATWHRAGASTAWVGLQPAQLGLSLPSGVPGPGPGGWHSRLPLPSLVCPSVQSKGVASYRCHRNEDTRSGIRSPRWLGSWAVQPPHATHLPALHLHPCRTCSLEAGPPVSAAVVAPWAAVAAITTRHGLGDTETPALTRPLYLG